MLQNVEAGRLHLLPVRTPREGRFLLAWRKPLSSHSMAQWTESWDSSLAGEMVHQAKVLVPNPDEPSSMPGTYMVERQPIPASCLVTSTHMPRHVGPYPCPPRQVNKTWFKVYFLGSLLILRWHCWAHESIHSEMTDTRLINVHRQQNEQPPVSLGTRGAEVPWHSLLPP